MNPFLFIVSWGKRQSLLLNFKISLQSAFTELQGK